MTAEGADVAEEFGPYRLEQVLGEGGMGVVYRAYDTRRDRIVALKRLPRHLAEDETFQARFRRESRMAARLNEPHIIPIHDFGEIDGQLYIDMRLVDGRDLSTVISSSRDLLTPEVAVDIVGQVGSALAAAHTAGLVHRDVKPSNIIITGLTEDDPESAFAYLVDFGIARAMPGAGGTALTSTTGTVGTLGYMAPERISGESGDSRSDIYSLACVLFECLTGHAPFLGEAFQVMFAHVNTAPPSAAAASDAVNGALDAVIRRGMAKNPDDRYQTANQFAAAARRAVSVAPPRGGTFAATPPPPPPPQSRPAAPPAYSGPTSPPHGMPTPPPGVPTPPHGIPTPPPGAPTPPPARLASSSSGPMPPSAPSGPPPGYAPPAYPPPGPGGPAGPPPRKRNRLYLIGAVAAVVIIGAVIAIVALSGGGGSPSAHQTPPAHRSSRTTHDFPGTSTAGKPPTTTSSTGGTSSTPAPAGSWASYSQFTKLIGDTPGDTTTAFRGATCELKPPVSGVSGMLDEVACTNLSRGSPVVFYVLRFGSGSDVQALLDQLSKQKYDSINWTINNKPRGKLFTSTERKGADVVSSICAIPTVLVEFYADGTSGLTVNDVENNYWQKAVFPDSTPAVC